MELYKKYRPKKLEEVVGQPVATNAIANFFYGDGDVRGVPHCLMFIGPSGTGKTTLARIVARMLKCRGGDLREINASSSRGIDDMRAIERQMRSAPIQGSCRVWIIDECQKLTSDAQNALLKPLEDTPDHVYFILCTTDPDKIISTVQNRATKIKVKKVGPADLTKLVKSIIEKEEANELKEEVMDELINAADGSARSALVILNQIIKMKSVTEQMEAICPEQMKVQANEIIKLLLGKTKWQEMARFLSTCKEDPEGIRRFVLACATNGLLKKAWDKYYKIINSFRDNYFDSGRAGLVASCYEVINDC